MGSFFQQRIMKFAMAYFVIPNLSLYLESPPDEREPSEGADEPTQIPPDRESEFEEVVPEDEGFDGEDNEFSEDEELEEEDRVLTKDEDFEDLDWSVIEEAFGEEGLPGEGGTDDIP